MNMWFFLFKNDIFVVSKGGDFDESRKNWKIYCTMQKGTKINAGRTLKKDWSWI